MIMNKVIRYIMSIFAHIKYLDDILYQLNLYRHKPLNSQITYTAIYMASFESYQSDLDNIFEEVGL